MFFGNIILMGGVNSKLQKHAHVPCRSIFNWFRLHLCCWICKNLAGRNCASKDERTVARRFEFILTASGMMVSTGSYTGSKRELAWRLPLYVQMIPASINALFIFFCPESPRWLYTNERNAEARQILAKFHSRNGDINSPVIQLEMEEFEEHISLNGSDKRWWDFRSLFVDASARYRTTVACMAASFGQLSGNGLVTYFLPVLLEQAGIRRIADQHKRLVLNFVNSITGMVAAFTGSASVDRLGRRTLMLCSTGALVVVLAIINGLLNNPYASAPRANAGITFIYIFMVCFSFGWTPMNGIYAPEVYSYQSRDKGLAFTSIVVQSAACINTFGLPVALEKIGWKVYLIFLFWDLFEFVMIYFFAVETKGLTLEELDDVFAHPNPRVYSTSKELSLRKKQREAAQRLTE
ncbi:hypothetical protein BOTBODRAFT_177319 [Botryobasidium botryosum FD-172 SS1]|uniref:Major facilitator superfamily (MFS) profile domain-containing protein n=1 Tax=Botryobasidium botryosum (strain FD-172 SS1) TaxID=930990 RepID=A0A067MHW8_BOTB1|nr:hypothetical protein BOTBODRAFT_177319 [Botryobasidium botryosum FD-172 SS1]